MPSGGLTDRLRRIPAPVVDGALVVAVAVVNGLAIAADAEADAERPDALAYALGAAIALPLLVRRRWPLGALILSGMLVVAYHALGYPGIGVALPLAVALFTAVHAGRLWAAATFALGLELIGVGARTLAEDESVVTVLGANTLSDLAFVAVVILLAETLRTRGAWMAEVRERERRTAEERERKTQRRVEQERLRIARELHDVLAHTVAVIGIQAGVAADALPDSPGDAEAPLRTIRDASREALAELRATVGMLRESRDDAPRAPLPGLAQLDELVGAAAGPVGVELSVSGAARPLPAMVDLAAYRIVQESLTNVLRHAGASRATVSVRYEADAVVVEVEDDGRATANGSPVTPGGHGLEGMRERAAALGGRLEAGPVPGPGRGFRVSAWLPTDRVAP